jgi:hypothetical protein
MINADLANIFTVIVRIISIMGFFSFRVSIFSISTSKYSVMIGYRNTNFQHLDS